MADMLLEYLGITRRIRVIALVGAGGKTSLMYALAREMVSLGEKVITTTTTKIFPPLPDQSPLLTLVSDDPHLMTLERDLARLRHVTVGQSLDKASGKVEGISEDVANRCSERADWLVVEADGSAGRAIKAPEPWEPVIPESTDLVIPVAGLECLGKPASPDWVFRVARFLEVTGLRLGQPITPAVVATVMCHKSGGLRHVPDSAAVVPFLNKADLLGPETSIESVVSAFVGRARRIHRVVAGQLKHPVDARSFDVI